MTWYGQSDLPLVQKHPAKDEQYLFILLFILYRTCNMLWLLLYHLFRFAYDIRSVYIPIQNKICF